VDQPAHRPKVEIAVPPFGRKRLQMAEGQVAVRGEILAKKQLDSRKSTARWTTSGCLPGPKSCASAEPAPSARGAGEQSIDFGALSSENRSTRENLSFFQQLLAQPVIYVMLGS
jgi:hypothetical protein